MQAPGCTRHPTRPVFENEDRAGPIGEWKSSTGDHGSDGPWCGSTEPSLTRSAVREPPVSPPEARRTLASAPKPALPEPRCLHQAPRRASTEPRVPASSTPDSSDLAPRRLASYRSDTPTFPSVALRGCWSSTMRGVSHPRAESECPTSPASVGFHPRRCRLGSDPPIRLPWGLECLETNSNHGRCRPRE